MGCGEYNAAQSLYEELQKPERIKAGWEVYKVNAITAEKLRGGWYRIFIEAVNVNEGRDSCNYILYNIKTKKIVGDLISVSVIDEEQGK